jgi:hypothetical protein
MHIDFPVPRSASKRPWNFRATDWEHFQKVLSGKLGDIHIDEHLNEAGEIDRALEKLEQVVLETMEGTVLKSSPSPYSKPWWNKDLERARRKARRAALLAKMYCQFLLHLSHAEAKRTRNRYNELISKSKQDH